MLFTFAKPTSNGNHLSESKWLSSCDYTAPFYNLFGTLTSAVGNCPAGVGVAENLQGYYNGSAYSFSINFPDCHVVVAMTGQVIGDQLKTTWLMIQDKPGTWNDNTIGTDQFTQQLDK